MKSTDQPNDKHQGGGRYCVMGDELRDLLERAEWEYKILWGRAVFGACRLPNGWILCSARYCSNPDHFSARVGEALIRDDIIDQLVNLEAYRELCDPQGKEIAWYKLPVMPEDEPGNQR